MNNYRIDANEILPKLWLGNIKTAYNHNFLLKYEIKYVITIMDDFDPKYKYNEIIYITVPVKDKHTCFKNMNHVFDATSNLINHSLKQNKGILVHCKQGHHRSASVIVAYLMKYHKLDYMTAMNYVRHRRPLALVRETCISNKLPEYNKHISNNNIISF